MKASDFDNPPDRDDNKAANRWRGPLFYDFHSPLIWKDKYYQVLEPPRSVTFPICESCRHVIWDWPHFEERVPEHTICDICAEEEQRG